MRRAFTLVELLVVIVIIVIISAVALPVVIPALSHRQMSEGARQLQGALAGARDVAIATNQPAGIRLLPDPTLNGLNPTTNVLDPSQPLAASRIIPISVAPPYSNGKATVRNDVTYSAAIRTVMTPSGLAVSGVPCLVVEESVIDPVLSAQAGAPIPNPSTNWFWNIRVGDQIQVNQAGPWYTVVGPMAVSNPELFVNVGVPGTISPLAYTIMGAAVNPEYLLLVNGQDDNNNGWRDEGFDGVDNDGDGVIDNLGEWEIEGW